MVFRNCGFELNHFVFNSQVFSNN